MPARSRQSSYSLNSHHSLDEKLYNPRGSIFACNCDGWWRYLLSDSKLVVRSTPWYQMKSVHCLSAPFRLPTAAIEYASLTLTLEILMIESQELVVIWWWNIRGRQSTVADPALCKRFPPNRAWPSFRSSLCFTCLFSNLTPGLVDGVRIEFDVCACLKCWGSEIYREELAPF